MKKQSSTRAERNRKRELAPGIVDHALLLDYLNEARVDDLVTAGCFSSRQAYALGEDHFALFASPCPGKAKKDYAGYTESKLSKRFGKFLHHVSRNLLDIRDDKGERIPSWTALHAKNEEGKALRHKWRALWGAHIVRQMIATFIGGLMGNWLDAAARTNDSIATLQAVYLNAQPMIDQLARRTGVHRPSHFTALCARLIAGERIDWSSFDATRPDEAKTMGVDPVLPPQRRQRRRTTA